MPAAGRSQEPDLAEAWDDLHARRYPAAPIAAAPSRGPAISEEVAHFDVIVQAWPEGQFNAFALAYGAVEAMLERRAIVLPAIFERTGPRPRGGKPRARRASSAPTV